jgi:antitoxin component of MazEF toxin-antitoxin module
MIGQRGRIRKLGFVDGDLVSLAKIGKIGHAKYITIPKQWLDVVDVADDLEYLSISIDAESIVLKPYRGEIGAA